MDGFTDAAVDGFAAEDATVEVDDLQGGLAFVADDPAAIAEERKTRFVGALACTVSNEHQFEAAFVVGCEGVEGVARVGEQVNIIACLVIDEVEISECDFLIVETQHVVAVLRSLEVKRHLSHAFSADNGKLLVVLRDVDVGLAVAKVELRQLVAIIKADDGIVYDVR